LIVVSATSVRESAHHLVQSIKRLIFNDLGRATLMSDIYIVINYKRGALNAAATTRALIVVSAIQSSGKENVGKENNKSCIFLFYIFLSAGRNDDQGPVV